MRRFLVTAFLLTGCGQILGVSDWVIDGDASSADVLQNDGAPPGDAGVCKSPKAGGLDGVLVQNEFCIDTTETPVALYDIFVNDITTDPSQGQGPECQWNTGPTSYMGFDPFKTDPQRAQRPISYVDWCDAVAFCKYWGKHLCGARGDGGPLGLDAQAKTDQWYTACTNGTSQTYPYGQLYDASACNAGLPNSGSGGLELVGNPPTCQGGVPGLFDMSGNAQEWENACGSTAPDAADDTCHLRGGTYFFQFDSVTCGATGGGNDNPRNGASPYNTIRCCWEP